jgi:predicted RNA-binding Zn-ribbon protein involved in translation (DUF1610 family)
MHAEGAKLLTREAFERQRAAVKVVARQDGRVLAFLSVGLGVAQLILLRWAEAHVARGPRIAIAGSAFLVYIMLIGFLWRRMKRRLRSVRPVCPQCGVALQGMSERVASATGKCDSCGGWILEQEE